MKAFFSLVSTAAVSATLLTAPTGAQETALLPLTPDDLQFSIENMDTSIDPAEDFYRYAPAMTRPGGAARGQGPLGYFHGHW